MFPVNFLYTLLSASFSVIPSIPCPFPRTFFRELTNKIPVNFPLFPLTFPVWSTLRFPVRSAAQDPVCSPSGFSVGSLLWSPCICYGFSLHLLVPWHSIVHTPFNPGAFPCVPCAFLCWFQMGFFLRPRVFAMLPLVLFRPFNPGAVLRTLFVCQFD